MTHQDTPPVTPPATPPAAPSGTPPASPPPAVSIVGADGLFAKDWLSNPIIPEELRQDKTLAAVSDLPQALKMLVNAQKMIGRDKIAIPKADNPAEMDAFYQAGGWPDKPDAYKMPEPPKNLPEGVEVSKDLFQTWAQTAHKLRLNQDQMAGVAQFYNQIVLDQHKAAQEKQTGAALEAQTVNKQQWGSHYDEKIQLADSAAAAFIVDDADLAYLKGKGFLTDPVVQRLFAAVGESISPDRMRQPGGGPARAGIQDQINAITSDAKGPYYDERHPLHAATVQQVKKLYEQLYPDKAA